MAARKKFLDRFSEHIEALDQQSRQAYILRLTRERGFFETVIDAVDEGILVIDRSLKIRYHNRAAKEMLSLPDDLRKVRLSQLLQDIDWQQILLSPIVTLAGCSSLEWSRESSQAWSPGCLVSWDLSA